MNYKNRTIRSSMKNLKSSNHSLLSPSGASKWITCTPSAVFESKHEDTKSNYADEGTLAHLLYQRLIENYLKLISPALFKHEYKSIKQNKFYTPDMESHCRDLMQYVLNLVEDENDVEIMLEVEVDLSRYVPEAKGKLDTVIITKNKVAIVDLKYGKGVRVEAKENKQQMLYALGVYETFKNKIQGIENVELHIYQPRIDNYGVMYTTFDELLDWSFLELIPAALKAFKGEGEYVPGSHCQFCKAKNNCKAFYDSNIILAKHKFKEPNELLPEDISEILDKAALFKSWLSGVEEYALTEALEGKKWPGFKLVEGRSVRKYANPEAIIKHLRRKKVKTELYLTEPQLVGITKLETNLSKNFVDKELSSYIVKPLGSPTLAREDDKRPALDPSDRAIEVFSNF